jgi:hypothetical protein
LVPELAQHQEAINRIATDQEVGIGILKASAISDSVKPL